MHVSIINIKSNIRIASLPIIIEIFMIFFNLWILVICSKKIQHTISIQPSSYQGKSTQGEMTPAGLKTAILLQSQMEVLLKMGPTILFMIMAKNNFEFNTIVRHTRPFASSELFHWYMSHSFPFCCITRGIIFNIIWFCVWFINMSTSWGDLQTKIWKIQFQ